MWARLKVPEDEGVKLDFNQKLKSETKQGIQSQIHSFLPSNNRTFSVNLQKCVRKSDFGNFILSIFKMEVQKTFKNLSTGGGLDYKHSKEVKRDSSPPPGSRLWKCESVSGWECVREKMKTRNQINRMFSGRAFQKITLHVFNIAGELKWANERDPDAHTKILTKRIFMSFYLAIWKLFVQFKGTE